MPATEVSAQPKSKASRSRTLVLLAGTIVFLLALAHRPDSLGSELTRWVGLIVVTLAAMRQRSFTASTIVCMLMGIELGVDAPKSAANLHVVAEIFLRLIRTIVAPLLFGALTTGVAGHGHLKRLGRLALKTFVYFEIVTTLALILGAAAIDLTKAGVGVPVIGGGESATPPAAAHLDFEHTLLNIFPENIAQAVATNQVLQVVMFAMLVGVALAMLPDEKKGPMMSVLRSLTETMFQCTRIVMYLAPAAAGAALAYTVGTMGLAPLFALGKLLLTYYGAIAVFLAVVIVPALLIARVPLRRMFHAVAEPAALGFATSASEAALPLAIEQMEEMGVPRWIVSFVIPTGYSFNMDGASLYLSIGAIFAAQAGGIHLTILQQALMLLTLMLTSKGIAGVPRATLVLLLGSAAALHLPTGPVMMIVGIDACMDMGRTALNVTGNCVAAAIIARWEGVELKADSSREQASLPG